ncbi:MAG: hypothetical protein OXI81_16595 [Paracoccaceae bacterium]|nr:hypothetical protein [Paracoccaceae bacterium]
MSKVQGLWIEVEFCTGCWACEMAYRQEHGLGPDERGIKVVACNISGQILNGGFTYDFVPIPTDICNLCAHRDGKPACVHHCMASEMRHGSLTDLATAFAERPGSAHWTIRDTETPRTGRTDVFSRNVVDGSASEQG